MKTMRVWIIRIGALAFMGFCMNEAFADYFRYQGIRLYRKSAFEQANQKFEASLKRDAGAYLTQYYLALTNFELGVSKKSQTALHNGIIQLETLKRKIGFFGRVNFYLAASLAEWDRLEHAPINEQDKQKILDLFNEALKEEPGSAWMKYQISGYLLKPGLFSSEVYPIAYQQLKEAARIQPDFFHKDVMELAWSHSHDYAKLYELTPFDYVSLSRLLSFIETKGLWQFHENLMREFVQEWEKEFHSRMKSADQTLMNEDSRRAGKLYEQALFMSKEFWMTPELMKATAGVLVTKNSLESTDSSRLNDIFSSRVDIGFLMPRLIKKLSMSPDWNTYEVNLKDIQSEELPMDYAVLSDWWGEGFTANLMDHQGRLGRELQLKSGRAKLSIAVEPVLPASRERAYLVIMLWDGTRPQWLGSKYLENKPGQSLDFEFDSTGGKRWLDIEMKNGTKSTANESPAVKLGKVSLSHAT